MGTKEEFISLLGKDRVEYLNDNNWIKFERRNFEICQVNEIVIKFLEKDGKGDNVIYFSISYNEDTKEWCAEIVLKIKHLVNMRICYLM